MNEYGEYKTLNPEDQDLVKAIEEMIGVRTEVVVVNGVPLFKPALIAQAFCVKEWRAVIPREEVFEIEYFAPVSTEYIGDIAISSTESTHCSECLVSLKAVQMLCAAGLSDAEL